MMTQLLSLTSDIKSCINTALKGRVEVRGPYLHYVRVVDLCPRPPCSPLNCRAAAVTSTMQQHRPDRHATQCLRCSYLKHAA